MIANVGCDLVEVHRIEKALQKPRFAQRVFTAVEIAYCESKGVQKYQSYAARYAAKEAVSKAMTTGLAGGSLLDIEVVNDALGKPEVNLSGVFLLLAQKQGVVRISLSLSHVNEYAMAQVVLEVEQSNV